MVISAGSEFELLIDVQGRPSLDKNRMENLAGILQNKVRSRSKLSAVTEEVRLHRESSFQNEYNLIKLKQFNYPFKISP